jgi:gluconolactonase
MNFQLWWAPLIATLFFGGVACTDGPSGHGNGGTFDDAGGALDDAGAADAGAVDSGLSDAGAPDAGQNLPDAGTQVPDGGSFGPDAGVQDAGPAQNPIEGVGAAILIQEGFNFLEGPVWRPEDGVLLFTDIPENKILRLTPPSSVDTFRDPSDNANGLANYIDGTLLAAEHGGRRVSQTLRDGGVVDFAADHMGNAFNSPNDIAVRSDGTLYFTDPPYGLAGRAREIDFNGLFKVAPDGTITAEWQGDLASRPNGLVLSPDESLLYVADTSGGVVRLYDVAADGSLSGERNFVSVTHPDGMAMDEDGNLYVTTANGVEVFAPDGSAWGTISVGRQPANCTFGNADRKTLYITARQGLYRVSTPIAGLP